MLGRSWHQLNLGQGAPRSSHTGEGRAKVCKRCIICAKLQERSGESNLNSSMLIQMRGCSTPKCDSNGNVRTLHARARFGASMRGPSMREGSSEQRCNDSLRKGASSITVESQRRERFFVVVRSMLWRVGWVFCTAAPLWREGGGSSFCSCGGGSDTRTYYAHSANDSHRWGHKFLQITELRLAASLASGFTLTKTPG